ncbi:DNA-binding transcriptional activator of the SARP family [Amycolatopsis marina]|uniref:DNA-binding transcriptional activator of the SARP family n=2 Tax=Amycolatopsis marina TaxID=490629 RepID=A0A1I0WX50_9PSEU|nr:DNA-binding transcriptional activator of the SARP family [Amycolatopsis marina]
MLLATLLLQPNSVVATDVLIDVLWPQRAPRSAAANIRTYVHTLRRRLDEGGGQLGDRLRSRSSGYLLTVAPAELDCTVFEERVDRARRALAEGDTGTALTALDAASRLWRGHLLEDLPHSHAWASRLARLTELRLSAEEQRLRLRIERGWHCDAIAELRGLLAEHPLREELWQQLIVALDASGRRAEALHVYAEAEQVLQDELDAEPGPGLRQLRARLDRASAKGRHTPAGAPRSPFPVCQLPLDLPDFTGRGPLTDELMALLRRNNQQSVPTVVVLSGAPGAGKSALAVRVAHAIRQTFPDGQLHIDLAGTSANPRSPLDVLAEVLRAVGVPDTAIPRGLGERSALLRSRLARRRLCVVLDDAACAAQVRPLLPGTGGCAVLVTSRVRMPDLEGAHPVEVEVLPEAEAHELLTGIVGVDRAAAEPDSIAALLDYCGHLPLAIRVAGARLAHRPGWTIRTLALRLHDERRRLDELRLGDLAVRASVGLSYDQLPADVALTFRLLALLGPVRFPGWLPAALLGRATADDVLDTLVDAHLVEAVGADATGAPRYRLHDLLRCYAAEQWNVDSQGDRKAALRRALDGYLALALEVGETMPLHFFGMISAGEFTPTWSPVPGQTLTGLVGDDPAAWFEAEHRWVVSAVELAERWGLDDLAWRLTAALTPFFDLRGHQDDWHHTHAIALAAARRTGDRTGQAVILRNLGQVHLYQDSYDDARAAFTEAAALFRESGDDRGVAIALAGLGTVRRILGEHDDALDHCHEALALFESAGDRHGEAVARIAVGAVWLALGCFACAGRWFTDAHALSAAIGDRHREAHALKRLAALEQHRGNLGKAREQVDRAIAIFHELGDDHCVGYANQNLGELYLYSGDLAHARLLLVNSLSVHRRNGDRRSQAQAAELLGQVHEQLGRHEQSQRYFEHALALWRELTPGAPDTEPVRLSTVISHHHPKATEEFADPAATGRTSA